MKQINYKKKIDEEINTTIFSSGILIGVMIALITTACMSNIKWVTILFIVGASLCFISTVVFIILCIKSIKEFKELDKRNEIAAKDRETRLYPSTSKETTN